MEYHWYDHVKSVIDIDMRPITSIVHQCQLYGHVAHYQVADAACWVASEKDNPAWMKGKGMPKKLMAVASQCLHMGNWYGKGACMGTHEV